MKSLVFIMLCSSVFVATQARRVTSRGDDDVNTGVSEFRGGVSLVTRFDGKVADRDGGDTVNALDHANGRSRDVQAKPKKRGGKKRRPKARFDLREDSERRVRDSSWFYCDNEEVPREVTEVLRDDERKGLMCSKEYPTHTCCAENDLTVELIGARIVEQIPDLQCARMMMKLRCAHCSPRSWWLFHAPDKRRPAHPRSMPILCPGFCRKFQKACRNHVAGLNEENYCHFHTTNDDGPCFPDYEIRRGTID